MFRQEENSFRTMHGRQIWIFKMLPDKFFDELKEKVRKILGEKGSHDFSHTERVYNYSLKISKDLDVDLDIVKAAALLHDIARPKEDKKEVKDHAIHGAIDARKILRKMKFPEEKIDVVYKCIFMHNKNGQDIPEIKEVRILKEADGLETMGAVGIGRNFSFLGEKSAWKGNSDLNIMKNLTKNLNLEYFKLPIAKELARKRVDITRDFCNQFIKEYNLDI